LYDIRDEIRIIIINDENRIIDDSRLNFNDDKVKIFYKGNSNIFERATLLHMKENSLTDESCNYWYVHTKGITHFNKPTEKQVLDWINLLLYWNIDNWKLAVNSLNNENYDTYGCNMTDPEINPHYSGNFWWAKSEHIKRLPSTISNGSTDPEFWICLIKPNFKNIFSSNINHYDNVYPEFNYTGKKE